MRKQLAAWGAAISMTVCVGAAILAVGGFALTNSSGVAPANAAAPSAKITDASMLQQQSQVRQLQDQVAQYQAREQQYQAREKQYQEALGKATTQLQSAQQQLQQFQLLLAALQQQGLITIRDSDGN